MTKVHGTGVYDFRRHRVAEYPLNSLPDKPPESKPGSNIGSSITLVEIQRDRLTKIAEANWAKTDDLKKPKKDFSADLVKEIYETELLVKSGRKTVPLQRVMILEVSQYLENYLWPNFDPETASFEHVMSMILMINEKVNAGFCFVLLMIAVGFVWYMPNAFILITLILRKRGLAEIMVETGDR